MGIVLGLCTSCTHRLASGRKHSPGRGKNNKVLIRFWFKKHHLREDRERQRAKGGKRERDREGDRRRKSEIEIDRERKIERDRDREREIERDR